MPVSSHLKTNPEFISIGTGWLPLITNYALKSSAVIFMRYKVCNYKTNEYHLIIFICACFQKVGTYHFSGGDRGCDEEVVKIISNN